MASLPALSGHRLGHLAARLSRPLGLLLSLAVLAIVIRQVRGADWSVLAGKGGLPFVFWGALVLYYFLSPMVEWVIYDRLWGYDPRAFAALLRKFVGNELLLDYLGDLHFLAWARTHHAGAVAPFAAVKDVTLLSALSGNLVTLVLVGVAWPFFPDGLPGIPLQAIMASLGVIVGGATLVLLFGKHIFSHPLRTLAWIGGILTLRNLAALAIGAVLWHELMPGATFAQLFLLATCRMVVSRLPLVPNKELLFAGLSVVVLGRTASAADAIAIVATLVLLIHLAVGAALGLAHIVSVRRARGQPAGD